MPQEVAAFELTDIEVNRMFRDVQAIRNLVNGIFNVEDTFLVEVQHDLAIFSIVRDIAIGVLSWDDHYSARVPYLVSSLALGSCMVLACTPFTAWRLPC
jgi:hypothetical protein